MFFWPNRFLNTRESQLVTTILRSSARPLMGHPLNDHLLQFPVTPKEKSDTEPCFA